MEPEEAISHLASLRCVEKTPEEERSPIFAKLVEEGAYFFEQPDIDPEGDHVESYLDDLAHLCCRFAPRSKDQDDLACDAALFLRRPRKAMETRLNKEYVAHVMERLSSQSPVKPTPAVARAALELLENSGADWKADFLYDRVALTSSGATPISDLWLIGLGDRVVAFRSEPEPAIVWESRGPVQMEPLPGVLSRDVKITGTGVGHDGSESMASLVISGSLWSSRDAYFQRFAEWVASRKSTNSKIGGTAAS